jgi:hypothetical protein
MYLRRGTLRTFSCVFFFKDLFGCALDKMLRTAKLTGKLPCYTKIVGQKPLKTCHFIPVLVANSLSC